MTTAAPLQLPLGAPYDAINAITSTDRTHGSTRYQITGPCLTGSITISGQRQADNDTTVTLTIDLGHQPNPDGPVHDHPTVNGIEASGTATIDVNALDRLTQHFLNPYRVRYRNGDSHLPSASSSYLGAAALAVARHWVTRPDLDDLMLATARHYAPRQLQRLQDHTIAPLRTKLSELQQELAAALRLESHLQALAATAPPPTGSRPAAADTA